MSIKNFKLIALLFVSVFLFTEEATYYVAVAGSDSYAGSLKYPFATLMKAQTVASSGDTVYIRGGTYKNFAIAKTKDIYNYVLYFNKSGIKYIGYKTETVIFDFSTKDYTEGSKRVSGFYVEDGTSNLTFENFQITGVPCLTLQQLKNIGSSKLLTQSEAFQVKGTNIVLNRISAHDNHAIGFYFYGKRATGTVYRCDAYQNTGIDSASYGNMDGFGAHGNGVTFKECRAWDNSDDNYDCINSYGANTFDTCWAFKYQLDKSKIQDGNGFKVGGYARSADYVKPLPVHTVKNCIAAGMTSFGFYSNHQPGKAATWTNNKAYNNRANFCFTEGNEAETLDSSGKIIDAPGTREEVYFNLAYKYNNYLTASGANGKEGNLYSANLKSCRNQYNSWNTGVTLTDSDFVSLDISQLAASRKSDGSLPSITFMNLNTGSSNYSKLKAALSKTTSDLKSC